MDGLISPVQRVGDIYLKRNDLIEYHGCFGGKAECIYEFIQKADIKRFVTCGSRDSLQCEIVSRLCREFGYECHVFTPKGKDTKTIERIRDNAILHMIDNGYMVVVNRRAVDFAEENDMTLIPFGMQDVGMVQTIAKQVINIPTDVKRIVVPVGGGITICGVMQGLVDFDRTDIEVLGVITGKQPDKTIKIYRPLFNPVKYTLIPCADGSPTQRYNMRVHQKIGDVPLDAVYEGKCYRALKSGDLLWIVGYHEV